MILFLVMENLITLNASDSSVALMVVFAVPKTHVHEYGDVIPCY